MHKTSKIFTAAFILVVAAFFLINMGVESLYATFSLYIDSLGGTAGRTGILTAVFGITCIVARILSGYLADAKSRWLTMLFGGLLFGASILACGYVKGFWGLFIIRVLQACGYSAATTATSSSVAAFVAKERLGEAIGYYGIGQSIATAIAPSIALGMSDGLGYSIMYAAFGILTAITAVFALTLRPKELKLKADSTEQETRVPYKFEILEKTALPATIVNFMISFSIASIVSFLTLYATDRGIENAGLFYTVAAVAMFAAKLTIGQVSDRFGHMTVLTPGIALGCLFFVGLALTHNYIVFLLCAAAYGFCNGMFVPVLNSAALKHTPTNRVGAASATFYCGLDAGVGIGAIFWGHIIDGLGFSAMYIGAAICFLIALILAKLLLK